MNSQKAPPPNLKPRQLLSKQSPRERDRRERDKTVAGLILNWGLGQTHLGRSYFVVGCQVGLHAL